MSERITQELRDAVATGARLTEFDGHILDETVWANRAEFENHCDAIDSIHANLERENDRLKCELDRVLGELDGMHKTEGISDKSGSSMHEVSITDELREWFKDRIFMANGWQEIRDIADRIDAEHERELRERDSERFNALMDAREKGVNAVLKEPEGFGLVELPKDADCEYIRIGDAVTCGATVWTVTGLKFLGEGWGVCCTVYNDHGGSGTSVYPPSDLRHYHAPTLEDVMADFAIDWECAEDGEDKTAVLKEYAVKLRLAGDAE